MDESPTNDDQAKLSEKPAESQYVGDIEKSKAEMLTVLKQELLYLALRQTLS